MKRRKILMGAAVATMAMAGMSTLASAETLTFGCQMYSDGMIDPIAQTNCAWNCMRYGISECLFKFDDGMVPQPWLAESYATDDYQTWTITLKSGIKFSDGCDITPTKVKEAFDHMIRK